jgi:hypothetical protein
MEAKNTQCHPESPELASAKPEQRTTTKDLKMRGIC